MIETLILNNKTLRLVVDPAWGSSRPNHRVLIRESILKVTGEAHPDLKLPPRSDRYSISISHAPSLGGYVIVDRPALVGFDIEESARITNANVARVSKAFEVSAAPHLAALWTAKEAAWKALASTTELTVVSHITIEGWTKVESPEGAFSFWLSNFETLGHKAQGLVMTRELLTLAVFIQDF